MAENEVPQVEVPQAEVPQVVVEEEKIELVIESAPVARIIRSAPVASITREELTEKLEQLSARARVAGISPLRVLLSTYARQSLTVIDGLLNALEENVPKNLTEEAPTKKKD